MSRFEEASAYHHAIHALNLRAQTIQPGLTEEQQLKRLSLVSTMIRLLEKARDEAVELGIVEWGRR